MRVGTGTCRSRWTTGGLADLVVLNKDYFAVRDDELDRLHSVLTVVGGEVVHDAGVVR